MELTIERKWKKMDYTIGIMYVNGQRFCETLEDTDRGLSSEMPVGKINQLKLYGVTAIPRGRYRVVLSVSPKFKSRPWAKKWGGRTPELLNVKGFSNIRIHCGTSAADSLGCVLIGDNKVKGKLINSNARFAELMGMLTEVCENGEEIYIAIR